MQLPAIATWLKSTTRSICWSPQPSPAGAHRDLRSALERSYRLLTPDEQRLFRPLPCLSAVARCKQLRRYVATARRVTRAHEQGPQVGVEVLESAQSLSDKGLIYTRSNSRESGV